MALVTADCARCGKLCDKEVGHVNRSAKIGAPIYCGRACSGLARRKLVVMTTAEKREAKAEYDLMYRNKNAELLKAKKSAYFQKSYNAKEAAKIRKSRMHLHVQYCRRPEYRKKKAVYDRRHLAIKTYGPFAEAYLQLREVEKEIDCQASRYEVYQANDTLNKAQQRRRAL
jgi:hypothetical protein